MLTGFLRFVFTSTVHVSTCTVSHCVRSIMVCSYSVVSLCSFRVHLSSTVCASLRLHCVPSTVVFPRSFVVYSAYPYGYTLRSSNALFLLEFSVRTVYSACLYGNTLRFVYCVVGSLFGPCRLQCVSLRQHTAFRLRCFCQSPSVRVTLPSTLVFTTHCVPFASVSLPRVPATTFKIRNLLRTRNEGKHENVVNV